MKAFPYLKINIQNLKNNLLQIKKYVAPARVMAAIKSDAYGHGLLRIATALKNDADYFLLDRIQDGVFLRKNKINTPIFIGVILPTDIDICSKYNLEWSLSNFETLKVLEERKNHLQPNIKIHLKLDTGMGRYGFEVEHLEVILNRLTKINNISLKTIYSHLASSENKNNSSNQEQFNLFQRAIAIAKKQSKIPLFHLANSGAVINFKESHLDLVRVGLLLYGVYHFIQKLPITLKPVLELFSSIIEIKTIPKGREVSYSSNWKAKQKCNIALISVGYGDGIHWHNSNKLEVIINQKKYKNIGNICMGVIAINLNQDYYPLGTKVIIIGADGLKCIKVENLVQKGSSISHEILTSLGQVKQRYYY